MVDPWAVQMVFEVAQLVVLMAALSAYWLDVQKAG